MRAFSLRRRHQLSPNLFILWRRWMAAQADQLLEAARLGSDKVEYLTHGQEISTADRCKKKLSICDRNAIRAWIREGAKNN
jgi:hypothetical protein